VLNIYNRVHTGNVISVKALKSTSRQFIVSQDDGREIIVWNIDNLDAPLIKKIGKSYNPVWYVQSLIEFLTKDKSSPLILSTSGNECKIIKYRIDLDNHDLATEMNYSVKGIPAAIA
jgi:WD40 repeat protein